MAPAEPGPGPGPHKPACAVTFGRSTLLGRHLATALSACGRWSNVDPTSATGDGAFLSLHRLAVEGTRRLLDACCGSGVGRVVYTGSADVVVAGARDVVDADEDALPYPDKFGNAAIELRAQVEMMVLSADGKSGMRTCVLRPSNMFGPGDSSLVRFIAGYARSPLGKFAVGSGANMCDFTYVENVAHANICAEQALCKNPSSVAGKAFFVTNDEPIETWEFLSGLMEAMGFQRPRFNLPTKILSSAALFSNMMYHKLGLQILSSPLLHPDTVCFLSRTRTLRISKARRLLGYYPIVSLEDGIMRTVGSLSELPNNLDLSRKQGPYGSSKAEKLLGSGITADILLWRDEKKTFSYVTVLFLLFYWFLLSDRTFVSSAAKILLVISLALFIHGVLPPQVFGFTVEKVTSDYFEVSQETLRNPLMCLASLWNGGIHKLRVLAEGDDWITFLKAVALLYCVKVMLNLQFRMLMGLVLAFLFVVFIVYEQCEEEIDSLVTFASVKIKSLTGRLVRNLPDALKAYIS
uniref:Reticulon-like protein n=1 Tax=Oryza brachyantha TaxID=4533 RepID=J3MZ81_ORYBR